MLIVLEGLDGAGKSTQVHKLKNYLEGLNANLEYIHFPRYDAPVYGNLISKFLRGGFGPIEAVHPQLVALLFAEDRHTALPSIKRTLEQGGTVLLDRFVYSNIAYQCAKLDDPVEREEVKSWILDTEFGTFGLPRPDLNIFLNVPIDFVEESLSANRAGDDRDYLQGQKDIHEADIGFQKKVREMYLELADSDPGLKVVDCSDPCGLMLDADTIFAKIKTLADSVIL